MIPPWLVVILCFGANLTLWGTVGVVRIVDAALDRVRLRPRNAGSRAHRARRSTTMTLAETARNGLLAAEVTPGDVLRASARPTLVTLGDVAKPWLKAFINESDLGKVKLGQKASVSTDSYPGKAYPGKVTFISSEAEFTPKNVQTAKERVKLVYRIKVSLANPQNELKPGMPAEAKIHLKDG